MTSKGILHAQALMMAAEERKKLKPPKLLEVEAKDIAAGAVIVIWSGEYESRGIESVLVAARDIQASEIV